MTQFSEDSIDRMRRAMDEDDGSPPPLWDPKPGEQLIGVLVREEERFSKTMNGDVRVAIVADHYSADIWSVFLSRSVLRNEFDKQSPRPGDTVGIKYFGRKTGRNGGQEYHHYSLRVARAADDVAPEPATVPAATVNAAADADDLPW